MVQILSHFNSKGESTNGLLRKVPDGKPTGISPLKPAIYTFPLAHHLYQGQQLGSVIADLIWKTDRKLLVASEVTLNEAPFSETNPIYLKPTKDLRESLQAYYDGGTTDFILAENVIERLLSLHYEEKHGSLIGEVLSTSERSHTMLENSLNGCLYKSCDSVLIVAGASHIIQIHAMAEIYAERMTFMANTIDLMDILRAVPGVSENKIKLSELVAGQESLAEAALLYASTNSLRKLLLRSQV